MQPKFFFVIWIVIHNTQGSVPIIVNTGPYPDNGDWKSEGQCTFTLDRTYVVGEITMEIVSNFPVTSSTLTIWTMNVASQTSYTYSLSSKYEEHAGDMIVVFHLSNPLQINLSGNCNSNVEPQELSTAMTTDSKYITTESAVESGITTKSTVKSGTTSEVTTFIYTVPLSTGSSIGSTIDYISSVQSISSQSSAVQSSLPPSSTVETSLSQSATVQLISTENSHSVSSSTNSAIGSPTQTGCMCTCSVLGSGAYINITQEMLAEKIKQLIEELTIKKDQTSAAQRKKISAEDDRPSAKAIGTVGVVVLCITLGTIVLFDLDNAIKFVQNFRNRYR